MRAASPTGVGPHRLLPSKGVLVVAGAALANVVIAVEYAGGKSSPAVLLALLPALLLLFGGLISGNRAVLVIAALGLTLTGLPIFT